MREEDFESNRYFALRESREPVNRTASIGLDRSESLK